MTISLMEAGAAARIPPVFGMTLTGCFSAIKTVLRPLRARKSPPFTLSMIKLVTNISSTISNAVLRKKQAFTVLNYELKSVVELPSYLILGMWCRVVFLAFTYTVDWFNDAVQFIKEGIHINLKGFSIGNGPTDPEIQYGPYTDYSLDKGLISKLEYRKINRFLPVCEAKIKLCDTDETISCMGSYSICNVIFNFLLAKVGAINYYDIRKKCMGSMCYDFFDLNKFLNQKNVRQALGVGDLGFVFFNSTVYQAFLVKWMKNLKAGIPALLEDGINMLTYDREYDSMCNWLGNSMWVHAMQWSGQQKLVASTEVPFVVEGSEERLLKIHEPLSFLKVPDDGHMVQMSQHYNTNWEHNKLTYSKFFLNHVSSSTIDYSNSFLEWMSDSIAKSRGKGIDRAWFKFSDSKMKWDREEYVLSLETYILFYAKRGIPRLMKWFEKVEDVTEKDNDIMEQLFLIVKS